MSSSTATATATDTPASSPPTDTMPDDNMNTEMQAEEDRMRAQREKVDTKREIKLEKERKADIEKGTSVADIIGRKYK